MEQLKRMEIEGHLGNIPTLGEKTYHKVPTFHEGKSTKL